MASRSKILERVVRLRALSTSPNPHEAEAAARMADRLMAESGITLEDVAGEEAREYGEVEAPEGSWGRVWKFVLATAAARYCGVEAVLFNVGRAQKVKFCGERGLAERARDLCNHLHEIEEEVEGRVVDAVARDGMSWVWMGSFRASADSLRRGIVVGISRKLARTSSYDLFDDLPAGGSTAQVPGLVRFGDGGERRSAASERYAPARREPAIDDVPNLTAFELGRDSAEGLVVYREDGTLVVRRREGKLSQAEGSSRGGVE